MDMMKTMLDWMSRFATNVFAWMGAMIGALVSIWTGAPALAQAVVIAQVADFLTGIACAALGRSQKSESGKVSSRAMLEGALKKGAEWLVVLVCIKVGAPLGMDGVGTMAMTYVIATELVSLLENFELLGLKVPLLQTILDVAHGKKDEK